MFNFVQTLKTLYSSDLLDQRILELLLHIVHGLTLLADNIYHLTSAHYQYLPYLPTFIMEFWSARLLSAIMDVLAKLVTLIEDRRGQNEVLSKDKQFILKRDIRPDCEPLL